MSSLVNKLASMVEPWVMPAVEKELVPDALIRLGVRKQCAARLEDISQGNVEERLARKLAFVANLKAQPIAIETEAANEQHYEVEAKFYEIVLGPRLKYSSGYWPEPDSTFEESEVAMLESYCTKAQLEDGMKIVDLGCGWGSLSLFLAAKYPNSKITSISNSAGQKKFIDACCKAQGLSNVTVITGNIISFDLNKGLRGTFDRVMSIEMFEHMKNYEKLLAKTASWLKPEGKLFVHIFTHKDFPYHFEKEDGWMAQYFFTGGTMNSDDMFLYFQKDLQIDDHWIVNGTHYSRTSEAWLRKMDENKERLMPLLAKIYGEGNQQMWFVRWRLFFIACAELFGYNNGEEWVVSHYLFTKSA